MLQGSQRDPAPGWPPESLDGAETFLKPALNPEGSGRLDES